MKPQGADITALLDPGAAARFLGVQRRTVMTWARRGDVPHYVLRWGKDGRAAVVRFRTEELTEWLAKKKRG